MTAYELGFEVGMEKEAISFGKVHRAIRAIAPLLKTNPAKVKQLGRISQLLAKRSMIPASHAIFPKLLAGGPGAAGLLGKLAPTFKNPLLNPAALYSKFTGFPAAAGLKGKFMFPSTNPYLGNLEELRNLLQ